MARTQSDREFDWSTGRELERKDAEIERLRLLAKRFANAIVTGQRHEGLICQAEDFLNEQGGSSG